MCYIVLYPTLWLLGHVNNVYVFTLTARRGRQTPYCWCFIIDATTFEVALYSVLLINVAFAWIYIQTYRDGKEHANSTQRGPGP